MAKKKKTKITSDENISIGAGSEFSLPLASLFGQNIHKKEEKVEKKADKGNKSGQIEEELYSLLQKISKVILRRRTSGFGGKTVVQLTLPQGCNIELAMLAKEIRKALGCGSRVEKGEILLQGDICDRAEEWLYKQGVKKVQIG